MQTELRLPNDQVRPIALADATQRLRAYCTHPRSGWAAYDLPGIVARRSGRFTHVGPWDILLAQAMNGRVDVSDIVGFTADRRKAFASLLALVPESTPLADMGPSQRSAIVEVCTFGYPGVRVAKITKVAALYRPAAVPILDSYVARIFGFGELGFGDASRRDQPSRRDRVGRAVDGLADILDTHRDWLARLRAEALDLPGIPECSDLRLLDIVLWTTQDDRRDTRPGERGRITWLDATVGDPIPYADMAPTIVAGQ